MPCIKKVTIVLGILLNKKRENYPSSLITVPILKKRVRICTKNRKRHKKKGPQTKKTRDEVRNKIKKIMLKDSFSDVDLVMAKKPSQEPSNIKEERKCKKSSKRKRTKKSNRSKPKPTESVEVFRNSSSVGIDNFLERSSQKSSIMIPEQTPEQKFQRRIDVSDNNEAIEDLSSDKKRQNKNNEFTHKGDQSSEENKYHESNRYEDEKDLAQMLINKIVKKGMKSSRKSTVEEVFKIKKGKRNKKLKKKLKKKTQPNRQIKIMDVIPLEDPSRPTSKGKDTILIEDSYEIEVKDSVSPHKSSNPSSP